MLRRQRDPHLPGRPRDGQNRSREACPRAHVNEPGLHASGSCLDACVQSRQQRQRVVNVALQRLFFAPDGCGSRRQALLSSASRSSL